MDTVGRCTPHRWQCGPVAVRKRHSAEQQAGWREERFAKRQEIMMVHGAKGVKCWPNVFPPHEQIVSTNIPRRLSACQLLIAIMMDGGGGLRKPPTSDTHATLFWL
jgi:hypothetical protein